MKDSAINTNFQILIQHHDAASSHEQPCDIHFYSKFSVFVSTQKRSHRLRNELKEFRIPSMSRNLFGTQPSNPLIVHLQRLPSSNILKPLTYPITSSSRSLRSDRVTPS